MVRVQALCGRKTTRSQNIILAIAKIFDHFTAKSDM
jgi:hypothetical protein